MSLSYSNTPVYIGGLNSTGINTGFTGSIDYVPAIRADVTLETSPNPKRNLGVNVVASDQFTFDSSLAAKISVESLIQRDISEGFRFLSGTTGAQEAYVPIEIGKNLYQKCYPTDISISVQPYIPATIRANFICLDPPTGTKISGDSNALLDTTGIPISGDMIVYGHTCTLNNMGEVVGTVQSQVNFTRRYDRSPVYGIGSVDASSMLLDGIEEEMSITSTGLGDLINLSGQLLAGSVGVSLQDKDGSMTGTLAEIMTMPEGARAIGQSYGVVGGETIQTSATLKNIKL